MVVLTDVSGQPIGPIYMGHQFLDGLIVEDGSDSLSPDSVTHYHSTLHNIPEAVAYGGGGGGGFGGFKPPPPKFRSFDKVEPDCKLSRKCLVFLFQHPN